MRSRLSLILVLALVCFGPGCGSPEKGSASDAVSSEESAQSERSLTTLDGKLLRVGELEESINQITRKAGVTGLSCAIIKDSKIVYYNAFGTKEKGSGQANDEATVFGAASFSKTVFAYLVMLLAEERIIDLDKPLREYLEKDLCDYPAYKDLEGDDRYKLITARHVLSHSTGFPNWRFIRPDNRLVIMFSPGERFSYSGEGILLLQRAVEEITGRGLEELAQEKVFGPFEMTRTSYVWQEEFENNFARPHDEFERPLKLRKRREADAAGSMVTTAGDYARFLVGILNAKAPEAAAVSKMLEPQISITSERMFGPGARRDTDENRAMNLSWCLGWGRFDTNHGRAFFHTGHDFGWQNYTVTYADKGTGIVLLSNSDNFESVASEIADAAIGDRYSPFDWLGYVPFDPARKKEPPPEPVAIELDEAILETYVGDYELGVDIMSSKEIKIKLEGGGLFISSFGEDWDQMFPETGSRFFVKGEIVRFEFVRDDAGKVAGLNLLIDGIEIPAEKLR